MTEFHNSQYARTPRAYYEMNENIQNGENYYNITRENLGVISSIKISIGNIDRKLQNNYFVELIDKYIPRYCIPSIEIFIYGYNDTYSVSFTFGENIPNSKLKIRQPETIEQAKGILKLAGEMMDKVESSEPIDFKQFSSKAVHHGIKPLTLIAV